VDDARRRRGDRLDELRVMSCREALSPVAATALHALIGSLLGGDELASSS